MPFGAAIVSLCFLAVASITLGRMLGIPMLFVEVITWTLLILAAACAVAMLISAGVFTRDDEGRSGFDR